MVMEVVSDTAAVEQEAAAQADSDAEVEVDSLPLDQASLLAAVEQVSLSVPAAADSRVSLPGPLLPTLTCLVLTCRPSLDHPSAPDQSSQPLEWPPLPVQYQCPAHLSDRDQPRLGLPAGVSDHPSSVSLDSKSSATTSVSSQCAAFATEASQ